MIVKEKLGNIHNFVIGNRLADIVSLEWYETNKRILHKRTQAGREVIMKFMNEGQNLMQNDVIYEDEDYLIIIDIQPCEAIVIKPKSMYQMAAVCYEIGNKHLPLFYLNDEIMVPFEMPLFKLLSAAGYEPKKESRKLMNQLKTTVSPHGHTENKQSLFSKILQLTTPSSDV